MDPDIAIRLVILIVLLILSAVFSSAETALTGASPIKIRTYLEQHPDDKRAKAFLAINENPARMLSTILVANNVVNLTASAITTSIAYRFGGRFVGLATGIITLLILIFGEITPKTTATIHAEKMALFFARPLTVLMIILTPVVFIVNLLAKGILTLLGINKKRSKTFLTADEVQTIVDVGHEEGVIQTDEKDIIQNVFELKDSAAIEVMVPRVHVSAVSVDIPYEDLLALFREEKYTRYPVYEDSLDNIIGIINIKDVLLDWESRSDFSVRNILREARFVFEYKKIGELLAEMKEASESMAVVVDEYGAWSGIITLEDVLEEIVGEIHDEYDDEGDELVFEIAPHEYLVEGAISLDDFNDRLGADISSENYESLGGFIIEHLDRIPGIGDWVTTDDGIRMIVESVDKNRVEQVHVWMPEPDEAEDDPAK